jgi:DNA-binding NarL/FixJ family response regulator
VDLCVTNAALSRAALAHMTNTPTADPTLLVLDVQVVWLRAVERIATEAGFATTTASSAGEALKLLRRNRFDVVMFGVDAGEGNLTWAQLFSRAKKLAPRTRFILVDDEEDRDVLGSALQASVDAYLTRRVEPEDIVFAIRQVLTPGMYLVWPFVGSRGAAERRGGRPFGLTRRESQALELLAQGRSNAEIGKELGITEQTVKGHLWRLYRKLGVSNRTAAARRAEDVDRHDERTAGAEGQ